MCAEPIPEETRLEIVSGTETRIGTEKLQILLSNETL